MPPPQAAAKPPAPRRRGPKPAPKTVAQKVSPADFERIVTYLTTAVLVERDLPTRVLVRGALAGVNIHFIGEPGVAKSLALREFAKCITGATYFEKQVHAQMPADALIGGYDPKIFVDTGQLQRNVTGKMPLAHIPFIDEIPRANGPTLDAILSIMNTQERQYESNGHLGIAECRFVVTASNTWFDADNTQAQALSHRITLMLEIEDIKSDESFMDLMRRDHMRRIGDTSQPTRETITLEQFDAAQMQVRHVKLSPEFLAALAKLRRSCKNEGLRVQPRAWVELVLVARANAWLAGRDHTIAEDLAVVEHGLWRDPDDKPTAHKLVLPFHGRFEREASAKRQEAAKPLSRWEAIKPKVEAVPPDQELEQSILTEALSVGRQLGGVKARVEALLAEADKEKRDAAALRELHNELLAAINWFKTYSLPTYGGPAQPAA